MLKGIDVSAVQGNVDWRKVRAADVRFAYLKCATGNNVAPDPSYSHNLSLSRAAGLWVGAYLFAFPLPSDGSPRHAGRDPVEQARHHFDLSGGIGRGPGELPPMLDLEWPMPVTPDGQAPDDWAHWGCSAPQIADWVDAYLEEADRLFEGPVGVYTYWDFFEVHLWPALDPGRVARLRGRLQARPLWMAWGKTSWPPPGASPRIVEPWAALSGQASQDGLPLDWTFWQVGQGPMPGQGGVAVDLDVFHGDEGMLEKLAGGPP